MTDIRRQIIDIVKRNWWIVAIATVAGAVVAYLVAGTGPTRFEATAPLAVDTVTLSTQARVPKPDTVIAMVQNPEFAKSVPMPEGAVLRAYATGNPQDRLFISVISPDEAVAQETASKAAEKAIEAVREYMKPAIDAQRALVDANQQALEQLGGAKEGDDLARYLRWDITKDNLNEQLVLDYLLGAYTFPGDVTVAQAAATRSSSQSALGGAVAGFLLGLVLVAVREFVGRRTA